MNRAALLLTLAACATEATVYQPDTMASDDDTDDVVGCSSRIVRLDPPDGAEVPRAAPVVMHLDVPVPSGATWSLEVDGVPGSTAWSDDRRACTWIPGAPLPPEQTFTVRGRVCGDEVVSTFRTGPAPLIPERLLGRAWGVKADDLAWVAPRSADLLTPLLVSAGADLVVDHGPQGPSLYAGPTDACEPPRLLGPIDFTANPAFSVGPIAVDEPVGDGELRALNVHVTGRFAAGGMELRDLGVTATLDLAALGELLPGIDACMVSRAMGEPCGPCGDGRDTCVPVAITSDLLLELPDHEPLDDGCDDP